MVCQAKIADFSIATLGSLMENLHIDEDSHIKVLFCLGRAITRNGYSIKNQEKSILAKFFCTTKTLKLC